MRERLLQLLSFYKINQTEFAHRISISKGMVSHILSPTGRGSVLTDDKVAKILSAFPEINKEWLVNGEGPMTNSSNGVNRPQQSSIEFTDSDVNDVPHKTEYTYRPHGENASKNSVNTNNSSAVNIEEAVVNTNNHPTTGSQNASEAPVNYTKREPRANIPVNPKIEEELKTKVVSKIVIFYKDGTFSQYSPDTNNY